MSSEATQTPGRDLDILVAEQVFGYRVVMRNVYWGGEPIPTPHRQHVDPRVLSIVPSYSEIPNYSTHLPDAWLVVEHIARGKGRFAKQHWWFQYGISSYGMFAEFRCQAGHETNTYASTPIKEGESPAFAICIAALLASEGAA